MTVNLNTDWKNIGSRHPSRIFSAIHRPSMQLIPQCLPLVEEAWKPGCTWSIISVEY